MKKQIIFLALMLAPVLTYCQDIFEKYEDSGEVTYIAMQPKMFQMLAKMSVSADDPDAKDFFSLVNSITSFKVITTESEGVSKDITGWVNTRLKSSSFEELMRVKDGDSNVKFYVKEGKDDDHIQELLMFVTGLKDREELKDVDMNGRKIETVLLSLTGDNIPLRQIAKLTDKMDLPGGDQLKKAGDKK
jgi:hypothetical protein